MAELFLISNSKKEVFKHVIFIHGLGGDPIKTWQPLNLEEGVLQWLDIDVETLGVWSVGYPAAVSRWKGSAMHLTDRALNLLERIVKEPKLKAGEIILIGHSLGGLVIKQLLRKAEDMAFQRPDISEFLNRVRRVAFIATPHLGADMAVWADWLRLPLLPSVSTSELKRNDASLRDLNLWYRGWAIKNKLIHLILSETQATKIFGQIVKPDSSDPGLSDIPIPIDADHITICKPRDRSSEIYVHILEFINRPNDLKPRSTMIEEALKEQNTQITQIVDQSREIKGKFVDAVSTIGQIIQYEGVKNAQNVIEQVKALIETQNTSPLQKFPKELIDNEIQKQLSFIKRARFFPEFSTSDNVLRFAQNIINGDFVGGTDSIKGVALAWCARFLAIGDYSAKSKEFLNLAKQLGAGWENSVAEAFQMSANGDLKGSLALLSTINLPVARSAAFFIMCNQQGSKGAVEWFLKSKLNLSELDADGKFYLLKNLLIQENWELVIKFTEEFKEEDYIQAPALLHLVAKSLLVQVIPSELKPIILKQMPFDLKNYRLASDRTSLNIRRKAKELFSKSAIVKYELGFIKDANIDDDYALWLELRDPEGQNTGLKKLQESMRDPNHRLRRLPLALQFGLKLDIEAVEQEIEKQTTITGDISPEITMARFSLAVSQKDPKSIIDYIDRHRSQIQQHLEKKLLSIIEIEMFSRMGLFQQAEELLEMLTIEGLSGNEQKEIQSLIAEFKEKDPIGVRIEQFNSSGKHVDLLHLVYLLEEKNDYLRLYKYSELLFQQTHDLSDAVRLAKAMVMTNDLNNLAALLKKYPEFIEQSDFLQMHWSWVLFREGNLKDSESVLRTLQNKRNDKNDRMLEVNIAIASGSWEKIILFVEKEYEQRDQRDAEELIRTAILAQHLGSSRTKDLVYAAVSKGANNAIVLGASYFIAASEGWEDDPNVAQWLNDAAELSTESGPIIKMSISDLMEQKPNWDRRISEMWQHLNEGSLPIFGVTDSLNRSLIEMFLLPALANPNESDPRRRPLVPSYSGHRQNVRCDFHKVAIEATSLLTLGLLGLLEKIYETFEQVIIPNSTLKWLFEEKRKIQFHQPSKISEAKKLQLFLLNGTVKEFHPSMGTDPILSAEIGEELASFIKDANADYTDGERRKFVIRSAPVYRIDTLTVEEADLSLYNDCLCSCLAVVEKLKQKGRLLNSEEQMARSLFRLNGRKWPNESAIPDDAVLYLDDLSISYFLSAKLLEKLKLAGLITYISPQTVERINSLLKNEQLIAKENEIIDSIRKFLETGIAIGKIKLGPFTPVEEDNGRIKLNHPSWEVIDLAKEVEAIVVDDRFLNQGSFIELNTEKIPTITTIDLIETFYSLGTITLEKRFEYRTKLRQAGYIFIPVIKEELNTYLLNSNVVDGQVIETAELKAIRENILQIRMSQFLQLPKEADWLNNLIIALTDTLKKQWTSNIVEATSVARSEWLLNLLDLRGWSHCQKNENYLFLAEHGQKIHIRSLIINALDFPSEIREKYWNWIERRVLEKIKQENPDTFNWLIDETKDFINRILKNDFSGEME